MRSVGSVGELHRLLRGFLVGVWDRDSGQPYDRAGADGGRGAVGGQGLLVGRLDMAAVGLDVE